MLSVVKMPLKGTRSGLVVECVSWHWGVKGSSLTRGTALCHWARHSILCLVLVQSRKTCPNITVWLLTEMKRIKTNKQKLKREVWGCALNDHGNYIVDHAKSWKNHGISSLNFCGNPVIFLRLVKTVNHAIYSLFQHGVWYLWSLSRQT